jgi:hypothetical protein
MRSYVGPRGAKSVLAWSLRSDIGFYSRAVTLQDDLDRIAAAAAAHGDPEESVAAVLATEPEPGVRVYLCAFHGADGFRSWLALDAAGAPVTRRADLRAAVSIAALCEVAADAAGGGDLDDLVARLEDLRARESPAGIEEAIEAAGALREVLGEPPQLASPARLDEIGAATRRLEQELDPVGGSPLATTLQTSQASLSELQREIEAGYRMPLDQ